MRFNERDGERMKERIKNGKKQNETEKQRIKIE
jgi:hypothetical protein